MADDVYSFSLLLLLQFPKFSPVDQLRVSTLISVPSFDVRLDQTVTLVTLNSLPELQKCVYTGELDWYPCKLTATKCLQVTFSAQIALAGLHFRDSSRRENFVTDTRYKWFPPTHVSHTYQIDVGSIVVIKDGGDLIELVEDLVVTGHVGRQNAADDSLADAFVDVGREGSENVGRRIFQNVERHRAVVIFQRRNVIVAQGQLRPGVDLLSDWT